MPSSGIPTVQSGAAAPANTALDSGQVSLVGTTGAILLLLSASASSAAGWTLTFFQDDGTSYSIGGSFAGAATQWVFLVGDIDGAPVAMFYGAGAIPTMMGSANMRFPGGRGARRPVAIRVQIQALGAGITGAYSLLAEDV